MTRFIVFMSKHPICQQMKRLCMYRHNAWCYECSQCLVLLMFTMSGVTNVYNVWCYECSQCLVLRMFTMFGVTNVHNVWSYECSQCLVFTNAKLSFKIQLSNLSNLASRRQLTLVFYSF